MKNIERIYHYRKRYKDNAQYQSKSYTFDQKFFHNPTFKPPEPVHASLLHTARILPEPSEGEIDELLMHPSIQ